MFSDNDFIYVTMQTLSFEQLQELADEVGADRSLLVLCAAFRGNSDFSNIREEDSQNTGAVPLRMGAR